VIGQLSLESVDASLPLRRRVSVQLVTLASARQAFEKFHYLHRARTGRQLNYAVLIDGVVDGFITYAYPMMSADLCGVPSDELLEFARMYLHSNIPHTATCAIGQTLRRVKRDWVQSFPDAKTPRLVVSWSDTTRHLGTIYTAANFVWLRRTKGQPHGNKPGSKRGAREQHGDYSHDKDCWIYWLCKEAQR
jgi:hypothetical protein